MKSEKFQNNEERTILIASIVHSGVLEQICGSLQSEKPFRSRWSNLVFGWCAEHWKEFQKAPGRAIEEYHSRFARSSADKEAAELIDSFLSGLSDEYRSSKGINEEFTVKLASTYFRVVRMERLRDSIDGALEMSDVEEAETRVSTYEALHLQNGDDWLNPFKREFLTKPRESREELVSFPNDLGRFFHNQFVRYGFICFVGPSKRGKSYWLQEVVYRALRQRRRVLYYVLGDLSEDDIHDRLVPRIARAPIEPDKFIFPKEILKGDGKRPKVRGEMREYEKGITNKQKIACVEKFLKSISSTVENPRLKIKLKGGGVISASDIERDVKHFSRKGWVPDVVVIDYADLLAPELHTKNQDLRHQMNASWMVLRRIALSLHCLVVTGSQSARTAYDSWLIRKRDFSEDRRKNDHITGMVGINQTEYEKKQGIYRLNWVNIRRGKWTENQVVWCAGNLSIACPCIISSL